MSKGQAIVNLINIEQGETITSTLISPKTTKEGFLFMTTKKGVVKKTSLGEFANIRRNGMIAINLSSGDELKWVSLTKGNDEILLVTRKGMSIRFSEKDARPMGRATAGVIGIRLGAGDELVGMSPAKLDEFLLVVSEKGYGKKSKISDWPLQGRAGSGVKAAEVATKNGSIMAAKVLGKETKDVIITSKHGQVIKLPVKDLPTLTRQTQGVILIRLSAEKDYVVAVTATQKTLEEEAEKAKVVVKNPKEKPKS